MAVGVTAAVGEMEAEEVTIGEMEAEELGAMVAGVMAAASEYRSVGPISDGRMEALLWRRAGTSTGGITRPLRFYVLSCRL